VDKKDPGRVPRTVECELTEDLVDSCVPGDVVTVAGTVKAQTPEQDKNFRGKDKSKALFVLYIDANAIDNAKNVDNGKVELMNFQIKELFAIQEISNEPNIFRLIVQSICPGIYGNELVKAGLALCLFGGCQKNFLSGQEKSLAIRGDPHILIVGDPGLGKSQMLTAINNIAPRSVYVCGSYSSTTGLTVTLLKEAGSGDYALEAGALVLGDQGCCCIDEFDKMASEHEALFEAMEQQSISIAKAGIVCTLPARTSVIAAANPVGGHYNRAKTVCENLKMNAALLSRFDLIFILLDKPDEERDHMLSEHVMQMHGGAPTSSRGGTASRTQDNFASYLRFHSRVPEALFSKS
jgi:DNA helicase MCM8